MTESEKESIHRAIEVLQTVASGAAPRPEDSSTRPCPVVRFARQYLMRDPGADITVDDLWSFYHEVAVAGEAELMTRRQFYRILPRAMEEAFGVKKSHSVRRDNGARRGFKTVTIRE